jgi:hypothetical protein
MQVFLKCGLQRRRVEGLDMLEVYFGSLENVLGLHRWSSLWGGRVAVMLL